MSSENVAAGLNFEATELTLGLPGKSSSGLTSSDGGAKSGTKRGFLETVDLNLGDDKDCGQSVSVQEVAKSPVSKVQVVGWPPVRDFRKKALMKGCKYVKVAVDGAPYLRKVDLQTYNTYQQLFTSLEDMFSCFTISRNYLNEKKIVDQVNGIEYVPTYEDKDGDWMLVGDVPWQMFVESCKRLRLMKSFEAIGLAPRTPPKCSSTN